MTSFDTFERPKPAKKLIDHCDYCGRVALDCSRFFGHDVCQKCQVKYKATLKAKEARK